MGIEREGGQSERDRRIADLRPPTDEPVSTMGELPNQRQHTRSPLLSLAGVKRDTLPGFPCSGVAAKGGHL